MNVRYLGLSIAIAISTVGCSGSDSGDDSQSTGGTAGSSGSGAGAGAGGSGSPSSAPVGNFTVQLDMKQSTTKVSGVVRDGPVIELVPFVPDMKSGDCQLFLPRPPFCDPACSSDRVCAVGDVCVPRPTNRSVGTVTVRGLATASGTNEFTMDPVGSSKAYGPSASVQIQYPPTEPGAEVRLSAAGGDFAPFEIRTEGIGPIAGFPSDPLPLESGKPLALTWTAEAGSDIEVVLEIAHHGGQKGKVICHAEDTGSLTIPATLVTELIGLGVAGFPDVSLTRKSVGVAMIAPGPVELAVFATVNRPVDIPGLTSCQTDEDCPMNQTCGQSKACE